MTTISIIGIVAACLAIALFIRNAIVMRRIEKQITDQHTALVESQMMLESSLDDLAKLKKYLDDETKQRIQIERDFAEYKHAVNSFINARAMMFGQTQVLNILRECTEKRFVEPGDGLKYYAVNIEQATKSIIDAWIATNARQTENFMRDHPTKYATIGSVKKIKQSKKEK